MRTGSEERWGAGADLPERGAGAREPRAAPVPERGDVCRVPA
jgi:hypothetical protein